MKIPTFDMDEYAEMERLVNESGITFQVELELHYNPVVMRMKELVKNKAVGETDAFNATNITLSPVWAFPWQGVPEKSYGKRVPIKEGHDKFRGGALCDHPHIFDLIREVTNSEFDVIFAKVAPNMRHDIEEEDMLAVVGRMKNGVIFSLDPSWSRAENKLKVPGPGWEVFPKRMEVNLVIHGGEGTIFTDCFGPNTYHNGKVGNQYVVQYTYFDEWVGLIDEFVENIESKRLPKINLGWHKNTIKAMNAVYESIATGKAVKM
jgi:predicted dehydrogenase